MGHVTVLVVLLLSTSALFGRIGTLYPLGTLLRDQNPCLGSPGRPLRVVVFLVAAQGASLHHLRLSALQPCDGVRVQSLVAKSRQVHLAECLCIHCRRSSVGELRADHVFAPRLEHKLSGWGCDVTAAPARTGRLERYGAH